MKPTVLPRLAAILCSVAPLQAQEQNSPSPVVTPAEKSAATVSANLVTRMPRGVNIEKLELRGSKLDEVVQFLESKQEKGNGDPLNVVLAPEVGELDVPFLSLRNVTTTEVLAICGHLLGLKVEPVPGELDRHAALIVKPSDAMLAPTSGAELAQGPSGEVNAAPGSVVTLASSVRPGPQCRVFSMAALLQSESGDARMIRRKILFENLYSLAKDQDGSAQLEMYPDLELIRVKTTAMPLIAQAIEAMREDVGRKAGDGVPVQVAKEVERVRNEAQALKNDCEARERKMRANIEEMAKEIKILRAEAEAKHPQ